MKEILYDNHITSIGRCSFTRFAFAYGWINIQHRFPFLTSSIRGSLNMTLKLQNKLKMNFLLSEVKALQFRKKMPSRYEDTKEKTHDTIELLLLRALTRQLDNCQELYIQNMLPLNLSFRVIMSKQIIFKCIHFKYERRPAILFTFSVQEMSFSADRSRANLSVISCVVTVNIHTRSLKIARQPW